MNIISSLFNRFITSKTAGVKDVLILNLSKALRDEMHKRKQAEMGIQNLIYVISHSGTGWNPDVEKNNVANLVALENLLKEIRN